MFDAICAQFVSTYGSGAGVLVTRAPGRVNLIGEYTDFNDGFVLPMTLDRGAWVAIRARADTRVRVASVRFGEQVDQFLDELTIPEPGHWTSYVLGVVTELRLLGVIDQGFEAVIDGDLIVGAGLSSSAALEMATGLALQATFGFEMSRADMALLCQRVEHRYAKVLCGVMDQFASGLGRSRHALLLDCRSLSYVDVPVDLGDHRVVIISSEVQRELASSAYNTRRAECEEGVALFRQFDPSVGALRDVSPALFEAYRDRLSDVVQRRCHHVTSENQRVLDAFAALTDSDLPRFGELMTASHASLRDDFEVSCDELDLLVEIALETPGVLGSRMTGAGFGGCTVSLVHQGSLGALQAALSAYESQFNLTPRVSVLESNFAAGLVE